MPLKPVARRAREWTWDGRSALSPMLESRDPDSLASAICDALEAGYPPRDITGAGTLAIILQMAALGAATPREGWEIWRSGFIALDALDQQVCDDSATDTETESQCYISQIAHLANLPDLRSPETESTLTADGPQDALLPEPEGFEQADPSQLDRLEAAMHAGDSSEAIRILSSYAYGAGSVSALFERLRTIVAPGPAKTDPATTAQMPDRSRPSEISGKAPSHEDLDQRVAFLEAAERQYQRLAGKAYAPIVLLVAVKGITARMD